MRSRPVQALAALALAAVTLAAKPAAALDFDRPVPPFGWGNEQVVRHWVYYPRYHHVHYVHATTDPHSWQYRQPYAYAYRHHYVGAPYAYVPARGYGHRRRPHHHHVPVK